MPRIVRAFAAAPPSLRRRRTPVSSISPTWRELPLADPTILLSQTLPTGQAFRWRSNGTQPHKLSPSGHADEWAGTLKHTLFLLRQAPPHKSVWYSVHPASKAAESVLSDYLRASTDFRERYQFCLKDPAFRRAYPVFSGVRTLRQHPFECLLSFICSSNNNIKRISGMVRHLESYGPYITTYNDTRFHAFPDIDTLAKVSEDELREAGFGYRAKFIAKTIQQLLQFSEKESMSAEELLLSWRSLPREQVAERLMRFEGVGRKVASCVALMSLDQLGEVPVDTHVWKIAKRYMPHLSGKTLTERVYDKIGDFFRARFGEGFAGVAHSVLFVAEVESKGVIEECVAGKGHGEEDDDEIEDAKAKKSGKRKNGLKEVYKKGKRRQIALIQPPDDFQPPPAPKAIVPGDE